jgi:hypothetical protein
MSLVESKSAGFRNKTDLKKFVRSHDGASTGDLVEAINLKLNLAMLAHNESHHHRLDAGRMLLELRARVEAEGEHWWTWREGKFDRGRKDMEKLMRLASADEPEVAAQAERVEAQLRMKRVRTNGANVRSKAGAVARAAPPDDDTEEMPLVEDDDGDDEESWQLSLGTSAGEAVALRALWRHEFGNWEQYEPPSELVTLAEQAAIAWAELVNELKARLEKSGGRHDGNRCR